MTESVHEAGFSIKDDGKRLKFRNKGLRMEGSSLFTPRSPQRSSHFVTPGLGDYTITVNGATTGTGTSTVAGVSGILTLLTSAGADSGASAVIFSTGVLAFEPDKLSYGEKLTFEARVRTPTGTALDAVWGFHDATTESSGPYVIAADSTCTTSVPTDFVGFCYSSTPTSGPLNIGGTTTNYIGIIDTCNDINTVVSTGVANDLLFHMFRVDVNAAGDCTYFVDDVQVYKSLYVASTSGVTPTVPLAGTFAIKMVGQAASGLNVDYFAIGGAIDTTA